MIVVRSEDPRLIAKVAVALPGYDRSCSVARPAEGLLVGVLGPPYDDVVASNADGWAFALTGHFSGENRFRIGATEVTERVQRRSRNPLDLLDSVQVSIMGEFALVAWQAETGALLAASSKMGFFAPFYYCAEDVVLVSGDLELLLSVLRLLGRRVTLDRSYLATFILNFPLTEFSPCPAPTVYAEVGVIPPAHGYWLAGQQAGHSWRYWQFWGFADSRSAPLESDVRDAMRVAVSGRCREHGNGGLLSGGLDSSSVCTLLDMCSATPVTCFSNTYGAHSSIDETFFAEMIASHIGATTHFIPADGFWALKDVPDLTRPPAPEPYQGWFYAAEVSIARVAASCGVTAVHGGIGGDELFGPSFTGGRFQGDAPRLVGRDWLNYLHSLRRGKSSELTLAMCKPKPEIVSDLIPSDAQRAEAYEFVRGTFQRIRELAVDPVTFHRIFSLRFFGDALADDRWIKREVYTPAGMEYHSPLFDAELLELVMSVPIWDLLHPVALYKPMLRRAMRGLLPDGVWRRKLKPNFAAAVDEGLFEKESARLRELLADPLMCQIGLADQSAVQRRFAFLLEGERHHSLERVFGDASHWQALTLEIWLRDQVERGGLLRL